MAKRRYGWDEQKISRFAKEGRGTGQKASYRPWLTVQDVPSIGRSSRPHSFKTDREHHLLSDLETRLFFLLEWADDVVDIREQFPLDREVTRTLAQEMGIVHPRDPQSGTDIVMTTDMLVDVRTSEGTRLTARAVKPAEKLDEPRVMEKLELERRYWHARGVSWHLVTDRDLPRQRTKMLRWLHEMYSLEHQVVAYRGYWEDRCARFMAQSPGAQGLSILQFFTHLEAHCDFAPGEALTVLRHLAARRIVQIDLDREFSDRDPMTCLTVRPSPARATERAA